MIRRSGALFALVMLAVGVVSCGSGGGTTPAAAETITLEATVDPGADPFTASVAISEVTSFPAEVQAVNASLRETLPQDETTGTLTTTGNTPGLYGGTQDDTACDTTQLIDFLTNEPDKAQAFATIVNQPVDQLPTYLPTLTPVVLTTDTWVTNHGYANGRPTPRQSVLQAGTAVLVDDNGTPRVKCSCGNPLAPPRTTNLTTADLQGEPWPDYQTANVTTINPAPQPLQTLTLTNTQTGTQFEQPTGSETGGGMTVDKLLNVVGPWGCDGESVQLVNGAASVECTGSVIAATRSVEMSDPVVGDLTGDGLNEGAAILSLVDSSLNHGPPPWLVVYSADAALLLEFFGTPADPNNLIVGIEAVDIVDGLVEVATFERECYACAPGPTTTTSYRLEGAELVPVS